MTDEQATTSGTGRTARDTRRALLDAGWRIFGRLEWEDLLRAIRVREVANEAGVTTGAFVHHFSTTERFYAAMAADARDRLLARSDTLFSELDGLFDERNTLDAIDIGVRVGLDPEGDLDVLRRAIVTMTVANADGDSRNRTLLRQYFQAVDDNIAPRIRTALAGLGREPLPPFTASDLAVILSALSQGLSIRRRATANAVDPGLASSAFIAAAVGLTRDREDQTDLDLLARHLDGGAERSPVALVGATEPTGEPASGDGDRPGSGGARRGDVLERLVEAGTTLFAERPPSAVTLDEVATAAGVGVDAVVAHTGTVAGLAAVCFARNFGRIEDAATAPMREAETPEARIEQVLLTLVEVATENRPVTEAFLKAALHDTVDGSDRQAVARARHAAPLPQLLQPYVRMLRDQGLLRPRVDSAALASTLVNAALLTALTRPHDSPERVVDDTCDLILHGALRD